jgi:hypothetical protein
MGSRLKATDVTCDMHAKDREESSQDSQATEAALLTEKEAGIDEKCGNVSSSKDKKSCGSTPPPPFSDCIAFKSPEKPGSCGAEMDTDVAASHLPSPEQSSETVDQVPACVPDAISSVSNGHQDEGSIIDEIVEEFLMADKDYREEKLSAKNSSELVIREGSKFQRTEAHPGEHDGQAIQVLDLDRQLVVPVKRKRQESQEAGRRVKRLIVEPDDHTRLICLIFPPPLAARPPFQVPEDTFL